MGTNPGAAADARGPRPPRAEGQRSPPSSPGCGMCTPHTASCPQGTRTGPRCSGTHTPETHTRTHARPHTPPSAQRLLPAAPPWIEPDSGDAGHGAGAGAEAGPVRATDPLGLARIRWGWPGAGAGAQTPQLRSAPPRGLRPFGDRGVVSSGSGGPGPLRMRTGARLWREPAGRWLLCSRWGVGGGFGARAVHLDPALLGQAPVLPPFLPAPLCPLCNTLGAPQGPAQLDSWPRKVLCEPRKRLAGRRALDLHLEQ